MFKLNLINRLLNPSRTLWQIGSRFATKKSTYTLVTESITQGTLLQRKWEILALLSEVTRLKPNLVMEIGTFQGANLRCIASCCGNETKFISLDLPGGDFGGGCTLEKTKEIESKLNPTQTVTWLRLDSHSDEALSKTISAMNGQLVDFLFIDGDHSEIGVESDFLRYGPLVKPSGLIAFHDIIPHKVHADCQVHKFWNRLRTHPACFEIIDRDGYENWGGIGCLRVPPEGVEGIIENIQSRSQ